MKKSMFFLSAVIGFVFMIGMNSQGIAQESDEFVLEEITVTAQKRAENQQKVAISMETVSGEDIREMGSNNLEDIISNLAGTYINRAGDGLRVSIRGMSDDITPTGALETMSNSTPTVAVNTDGVFSSKRSSGSGLYDLERVEVLYGPQSTMYASNSPGGIVNIVTASPKIDVYEASGTIEYGSYNLLHTEGSLNAPVSDSVALRAAFTTSVHDGYMANGSTDEDTKSGRLKMLYSPNEAVSLIVTGELTRSGGSGYSGIDMFVNQDDLDDPWDNSDEDTPDPRSQTAEKLTAQLDWDLNFASLSVLPSYSTTDLTSSMELEDATTGEPYHQDLDSEGFEKGIELRLSSNSDSDIKWIVGMNYYKSEQEEYGMPDTGLYQNRFNNQEVKAIFGNLTYPVTEAVRIAAGLRQSWDENYTLFESLMQNPMDASLVDVVYDETNSEYDSPDYKLGIEYDLGEDSMLYADFTTSYRTMGMTLATAEPEKLKAYTVGAKNRFLDNKLQLNVSAYYYDYRNYLADAAMSSPDTGRLDDGSQTSGDLKSYGVDIQTTTIISANDQMDLSVSYLHSEFDYLFFDYVSEYLVDNDYSGKRQTFAPEWTVSFSYRHIFDLPNGGNLTARFDSRYQSAFLVSYMEEYTSGMMTSEVEVLDLTGYNEQEAHHISNLSLIYAHPDGQWTLTGYVKNLEDYAEKKNLMMSTMMVGDPRTYGAVLSVRY